MKSIEEIIKDFNKVINCLALELPEPVWNDVHFRWIEFQNKLKSEKSMENKDKEAILKEVNPKAIYGRPWTREMIKSAMDKHSASQNEELIKENEELKNKLSNCASFADNRMEDLLNVAGDRQKSLKYCHERMAEAYSEITQLQSTIDEKNKEIKDLLGYAAYVDRITAKGEKPMSYEAYK